MQKYTFEVKLVKRCGMEVYVGTLKFLGQTIYRTEAMSDVFCRKQVLEKARRISMNMERAA